MQFSVPDMSCQHCVSSIRQAFANTAPESVVRIDLSARHVDIVSQRPEHELIAIFDDAGFEAHRVEPA